MYLMTEEEELAALSMCQGYLRLKELGWRNIAEFEPPAQGFVPPFLGIEVGSLRPIECEYDKDRDIFTTLNDDDPVERRPRFADLIMFRPYPSPEIQSPTPPKKSPPKKSKQPTKSKKPKQPTKSKQPKKSKQAKKSKQPKKKG